MDPAMIDHVGFQVDDLARARAFYDAVLEPLGYAVALDVGPALGYGVAGDDWSHPRFWIATATDAVANRQSHIAFTAPDRAAVDAFHERAVALGAESLHEPRIWSEYHGGYYGAFVRDPDGNNVEAVHHTYLSQALRALH